jgi:hypothetical protein
MLDYVSYGVWHASQGVGSHMIRLRHPGCWSNHASGLYAPPDATEDDLLSATLFEARAKIGVTVPGHPKARTLAQAIEGGDAVEVYRLDPVPADAELAAFNWDLAQSGKEYDTPGLLGFLPLTLLRRRAIEQQQKRQYDSKWWCSEYRMAQTMKRGLPGLQNVAPFQVDPEWLRTSPLMTFVFGAPDPFPHIVKS